MIRPFAKCNQDKRAKRSQQGSIAIFAAISISLVVVCLASLDIGNHFWKQREIQRIADAAALAGSQRLGEGCIAAQEAAQSLIDQYSPKATIFKADCGYWSPTEEGSFGQLGGSGLKGNPKDHFSQKEGVPLNALKITAKLEFSKWFPLGSDEASPAVAAEAIGYHEPIAGFSLGTGVAAVNGGVVNTLLSGLLGVKVDVVSYSGLANASLNLLDLAVATKAGSIEKLLSTQVTTKELIVAMIEALGTDVAAIRILRKIANATSSTPTPVLNSVKLSVSDILKINSPMAEAAASAQVNAFEMLLISAQIANGKNAVNLATGIDLGIIAKVDLKLSIIEPPFIAIGPAGKISNKWITEARSAQVRLLIDSKILNLPNNPVIELTALKLPINIQAAPGKAWLSSINCAAPVADSVVQIGSAPGVALACIAESTNLDPELKICNAPATIAGVRLLGIGLIDIKAMTVLGAQTPEHQSKDLFFDGVIGNSDDTQRTSTSASTALNETLKSALSGLKLEACVPLICISSSAVTKILDNLNGGIIAPLLGTPTSPGLISTLIQPLLELLGVQLGYSDIHHQSLTCRNSELVF